MHPTRGSASALLRMARALSTAVAKVRNDLWMLTGYRQPGLWNQIKDAFHFGKPN